LFEEGFLIEHILGDGKLEGHEHAMERLISKFKIPEGDMFRSHNALVEAYARQSVEIAYREQVPETPVTEKVPTKVFPGPAR
jgi:hypothetical protein